MIRKSLKPSKPEMLGPQQNQIRIYNNTKYYNNNYNKNLIYLNIKRRGSESPMGIVVNIFNRNNTVALAVFVL